MKKILVFLLAAVMFCMSLTALAEGNAAVTLEVDADRLPVYAADDPYPDAFRSGEKQAEGETLPILLLPVKKNLQLRATVKPGTVKNKKTVLSAADESVAQVRGNTVTGLKPGETVLTVARLMTLAWALADPTVIPANTVKAMIRKVPVPGP